MDSLGRCMLYFSLLAQGRAVGFAGSSGHAAVKAKGHVLYWQLQMGSEYSCPSAHQMTGGRADRQLASFPEV